METEQVHYSYCFIRTQLWKLSRYIAHIVFFFLGLGGSIDCHRYSGDAMTANAR